MSPRTRAIVVSVAIAALASLPRSSAQAAPAAPPAAAPIQATAEARRLSDGFVAVADRVSPSVVQIEVTVRDEKADALAHLFGRGSRDEPVARAMGSGVIFAPDGTILTNNHVVEEALTINVRLRDGRYLPAVLVGRDPATDLAVIRVDATGLPQAKFADSDAARVGEWVVAIGSPFGLGYTVTAGVLSAKGRGGIGMNLIEDYLQTDASINPGNSGGPLCDLQGEVLGVNTMIVGRGQGIGFAVPSNIALRVAGQIIKTGRVSRPWLGVAVQDVTPEIAAALHATAGAGALVNNVASEGPAHGSNLRAGDIIASVDGHPLHDAHDLIRETITHEVGQSVPLEIVREGKHYAAKVTLTERPESTPDPTPAQQPVTQHQGMGLAVRDLPADVAAQRGFSAKPLPVLTRVVPGSAADRAGLRVDDAVVEANGVQDPTSSQVADAAKTGSLLLRVKRGEAYFYAAMSR